jgi:cephalosporin hydroxylase
MRYLFDRKELIDFFQEHYQTGVGAEVGSYQGEFSSEIAKVYKGKIIDIDWYSENDLQYHPHNKPDFLARMEGLNYELREGKSVDVAKTIEDESLDWVYIDADHRYEAIKADLEAYFPKVRKGGVVSGHDYTHHQVSWTEPYVFGVIEAVNEFCKEHGYEVNVTSDSGYPNWWFVK